MRRTGKRFAFIVIANFLSCMQVHAFETYQIVGIAPPDQLTIREEPVDGGKVSNWKGLGTIPAGATGVLGTGRSKLIGTQRWLEVSFAGTRGWVNAKFVEGDQPTELEGEKFNCSGTEPFWGVMLGPSGGEYSDPETKTVLTTERVQPATARLFPLLYRMTDSSGRKYRATVSHQNWCTDGMSDYDYAFQVLLSTDEEFQQGCCVLAR